MIRMIPMATDNSVIEKPRSPDRSRSPLCISRPLCFTIHPLIALDYGACFVSSGASSAFHRPAGGSCIYFIVSELQEMSYWVTFTTRECGVETLHNIRWITVRQDDTHTTHFREFYEEATNGPQESTNAREPKLIGPSAGRTNPGCATLTTIAGFPDTAKSV